MICAVVVLGPQAYVPIALNEMGRDQRLHTIRIQMTGRACGPEDIANKHQGVGEHG